MLSPDLDSRTAALARAYCTARPFRHVLIEPFFEPAALAVLLAQFPAFARGSTRSEDGSAGRKAVVERIAGLGGAYARLDALLQTRGFLDLIGRITSIPQLLYDPDYFGGGTHESLDGQELDPHVDFNRHPRTSWHRRLNLIVYLNPRWEDAWGGSLELFADPRQQPSAAAEMRLLTPLCNRAVLFETTDFSWHGFSRIRLPPAQVEAGLSRRSLALYFYSSERPAAELSPTHSTIYVDRPLPARLSAGHQLDATDVAELQALVDRRDQHNRRLYQDLAGLQAQLDQARAQLGRSAVQRLLWYLGRLLRRPA